MLRKLNFTRIERVISIGRRKISNQPQQNTSQIAGFAYETQYMVTAESKEKIKRAVRLERPLELIVEPSKSLLDDGCIESNLRSGEEVRCRTFQGDQLPEVEHSWIFDLFDRNMRKMYEKSQSGYDPDDKKSELFASTARYLIVYSSDNLPIGYSHFRFDEDFGWIVLYCYELQVEPEYQRQGVGAIMLNILEKLAEKTGMEKVLATVFTFNQQSQKFFRKRKFARDETSPVIGLDCDYIIFSKPVKA